MGLVDFTNPAACRWFGDKLRALVDMGVDCFKTDFGERIPTDVVYFDGSDPVKMHNYYTYLYNKTVFEVLEEKLGKGEAAVFARSATAGGQQFPVHWGGDSTATFESMAESLRGGLSLACPALASGATISAASSRPPRRMCTSAGAPLACSPRTAACTARSSYRVPWLFDERKPVRRAALLHQAEVPPDALSVRRGAARRTSTGMPVMRAMLLEFPDDPGCDTLDRQYMLGDSLLVAPVFSHDGMVDYYLPPGAGRTS